MFGYDYFLVEENRLSGTIPPSIFNLSSLEKFDVGVNQIQGRLRSEEHTSELQSP